MVEVYYCPACQREIDRIAVTLVGTGQTPYHARIDHESQLKRLCGPLSVVWKPSKDRGRFLGDRPDTSAIMRSLGLPLEEDFF